MTLCHIYSLKKDNLYQELTQCHPKGVGTGFVYY